MFCCHSFDLFFGKQLLPAMTKAIISVYNQKEKSLLKIVQWASPFCEKVEKAAGIPLLVTPCSTYTLGSNGNFSHEKAEKEPGFSTRPIEETLADIVLWIRKEK